MPPKRAAATEKAKPSKKRATAKSTKDSKRRNQIEDVEYDEDTLNTLDVVCDGFSLSNCKKWFQQYATKAKGSKVEGLLERSGMEKLFKAVDIPDDNILALIVSHKLGVMKFNQPVAHSTFLSVMAELRCDSDKKLKYKLPELRERSKDSVVMLRLCTYAFNLVKSPGEKTISKDLANELFSIMLKDTWPLFPQFKKFYEESSHRSLSLDTFGGFCDLANRYPTLESLKTYDTSMAWPSLADEFVENMLSVT